MPSQQPKLRDRPLLPQLPKPPKLRGRLQ